MAEIFGRADDCFADHVLGGWQAVREHRERTLAVHVRFGGIGPGGAGGLAAGEWNNLLGNAGGKTAGATETGFVIPFAEYCARVQEHIERSYGLRVVTRDIPDPLTGDLD